MGQWSKKGVQVGHMPKPSECALPHFQGLNHSKWDTCLPPQLPTPSESAFLHLTRPPGLHAAHRAAAAAGGFAGSDLARLSSPRAVAVGDGYRVYVLDTGNGRLLVLATGEQAGCQGGQGGQGEKEGRKVWMVRSKDL